jgi:hypothetical protein
LQSKTSTAKRTLSSSAHMSRIHKRNCTCSMPSRQYHVPSAKPTGLSSEATPSTPVSLNACLHLSLSKAFSSRALSAPYSG